MRAAGRCPLLLDERPAAAEAVDIVGAEPLALGVAAVELGFDQRADVDVVDDETLHEAGELDVDQQDAVHPHTAQVALAEHRATEIGGVERRGRVGRCHSQRTWPQRQTLRSNVGPSANRAASFGSVEAPMATRVETPVYEGPFDLLLQLILAEEVDLYEVSLARIVDAYLAEIDRMQSLDLDVATEFLLIAATLVELKARRLLPGSGRRRPRRRARLVGGARPAARPPPRVQDVQGRLGRVRHDERAGRPSVARRVGPDERFDDVAPDLLADISPLRLRDAAIVALTPKPVPRIDLHHVAPIRVSVADAVAELIDELPRVGRITFARLTADLGERLDVIVRFLAVLELFKQGLVEVDQSELFGDITIEWVGGDAERAMALVADVYEG